MIACAQSIAMFGSELWWKGDRAGTKGRADDIQKLANQEARAATGCFRTTNAGALAMESGLRPAATRLENRQKRYRLRLVSLPQGGQAKELSVQNQPSGKGYRCVGRMESTVLLEAPEALDVTTQMG